MTFFRIGFVPGSESIESTGVPRSSVAAIAPPSDSRTRSTDAPGVDSLMPRQENGIGVCVRSSASACCAASSNAGCSRYPPGSPGSGRCTSARVSEPQRQAARSPWNTGPYAYPDSANRS